MNDDDPLKSINEKILANTEGQSFPVVQLVDGSIVRTGTFATFVYNIFEYNKKPSLELENEIRAAIPTLIKIGLFNLFEPNEWMSTTNKGRHLVGTIVSTIVNPPKEKS
jgi:hypothetical protein